MKALFLAGGMGLRLQPLTNKLPKPMVPIMNKPLLERTFIHLKKIGITEIVISSCYQPDYLKNYFGNGEKFGLKIQYIVEEIPLGTGGAIRKAASQFEKTFVVFNSDILSDMDLKKMIYHHKENAAQASIAVTEVSNPSEYGVIEYNNEGQVVSFIEKPKPGQNSSNFINAGIYIFEPEIVKEIPSDKVISIERDIFPKYIADGYKIIIFKNERYWIDIGTIEKYMQVHKDIMSKKCAISGFKFEGNEINMGKNVKIHPTAKLIGPAFIGDNVEICAKATVSKSIIGNNVFIGEGSSVISSIFWNDIKINRKAKLINTIVTSNSLINTNSYHLNDVYSNDIREKKAQ
ncbi:MAG: NDP-sugar synthase [Clostridiales bacterium]